MAGVQYSKFMQQQPAAFVFEGCVKILESSSFYVMFMSLDTGDKKTLLEFLIYKMLHIMHLRLARVTDWR